MRTKTGIICLALVLAMAIAPAMAVGPSSQAGKSNIGHLYLVEKNPSDWTVVEGGAWGKMTHVLSGPTFDFVFNGHGLQPNTGYTLIYYVDQPNRFVNWGKIGAVLAGGTSDEYGDIHLAGSDDIGSIPISSDLNYPAGAKIWLILSSDYSGLQMTAWNPTEYLFETALITYTKT